MLGDRAVFPQQLADQPHLWIGYASLNLAQVVDQQPVGRRHGGVRQVGNRAPIDPPFPYRYEVAAIAVITDRHAMHIRSRNVGGPGRNQSWVGRIGGVDCEILPGCRGGGAGNCVGEAQVSSIVCQPIRRPRPFMADDGVRKTRASIGLPNGHRGQQLRGSTIS